MSKGLDWRKARKLDLSEPGYKDRRLERAADNWINHGSLAQKPLAEPEPAKKKKGPSKIKVASNRRKLGNFRLPSPDEIERARTPSGRWTALQLAEWGVKWPPKEGWRRELERRWRVANGFPAGSPKPRPAPVERKPRLVIADPEQVAEWQYEAGNGYTTMSLDEWLDHKIRLLQK